MAPPAAPTDLVGAFNADDTITLTWTDNATTEDGYRVFESTDGGNSFSNISSDLPSGTESYTTGLRDRDIGYVYFVEAFNADGISQSGETLVLDDGYAVDDQMDQFSEEPMPAPPNAVETGVGGGPIDPETGYIVDEGMDRFSDVTPQAPTGVVEAGAGGGPIEQETGYLVDERMDRFTDVTPQAPTEVVEVGVGGGAIDQETGYLVDERIDRFSSWPPAEEAGLQAPPPAVELGDGAGGFSAGGAASFGLVPGLAAFGGGKPGSIGAGFRG